MTSDKFEYEVAFSFLQQDERLAYEINDLIQDRYKTFIYSEHQKELAGRDGEEVFNDVFGKKTRIVVVLYRDNWGKAGWTRIEETAIRNRAHDDGYDFTLFIKLDGASKMPNWVPKNRIYFNFDRWGAKGVAPVIEQKVQEYGGEARPESIEDRAERLKRHRILEQQRETFLISQESVVIAKQEVRSLIDKFKNTKSIIEDPASQIYLGHQERGGEYPLYTLGFGKLYLCFNNSSPFRIALYNNAYVNDGCLLVSLYEAEGHYNINRTEKTLAQKRLKFDRDLQGNNGWSDLETGKNFLTTDQLLDIWVKKFIDDIGKRRN